MTTALIIDDHDDIRVLIKYVLELSDDRTTVVAEAADGQAALDWLQGSATDIPHVVVVDWMMPGLNGIETSIAIKADRPQTRIILCSAFGDDQLHEAAADAGIDLVMSKEQIGEIPDRIRELLAV